MNDIFNENVPLKTETPAFAKHVLPAVPSSEVYLEDCVTALKRYADNHFDLAIVDPPYGINGSKGTWGSSNKGKVTDYGKKDWDKEIPTEEYFLSFKEYLKIKSFGVEIILDYSLQVAGLCGIN
jgi:DNA modification methylase